MAGGRALLALLLAQSARGEEADPRACTAAGVGRAAFRHRDAVRWMNAENAKRAPIYIEMAKQRYQKGLNQRNGVDKTNSDPYIACYDAQHQVMGALDLDPENATIWLHAGQTTAMIASLDQEAAKEKLGEARQMIYRAIEMDPKNLDEVLAWAKQKVKDEDKDFTKVKKALGKAMAKLKDGKVPSSNTRTLLPWLEERKNAEACDTGAPMDPVEESAELAPKVSDRVKAALADMAPKQIFPTIITTANVAKHFGPDFCKKLSDMAVKKYRAFTNEHKKRGMKDPNDINDAFFSAQSTSDESWKSPQALKFWKEMYTSPEFQQLQEFLRGALFEHAVKSGYPVPPERRGEFGVTSWAAVYLEDGGRHGYHVHQGSLSSCVFYARAPPGKTPIMFVDPRGAPPTNDYEQHLGEHDFEPTAPFHHNYQFFAEAGDLVCFPSWLVHRVPSHYETLERVAFPANLQAGQSWDPWFRSARLL